MRLFPWGSQSWLQPPFRRRFVGRYAAYTDMGTAQPHSHVFYV